MSACRTLGRTQDVKIYRTDGYLSSGALRTDGNHNKQTYARSRLQLPAGFILALTVLPVTAMSDSDLDADLLLAAGGGGRSTKKRAKGKKAVSDEEEYSSNDDEASDEGRPFEKDKKKAVPLKKRKTGGSDDEDHEMDDQFDDGYGSDLMGDDADRAYLNSLTMLEREMTLADRAEKRMKQQERQQLLKLQRQAEAKKVGTALPAACQPPHLRRVASSAWLASNRPALPCPALQGSPTSSYR
jgi:hypothetical protein